MRAPLAAALLLAAAPALAQSAPPPDLAGGRAEKIKLAVLDLSAAGASADLAASLTTAVASELDRLEVFSIISRQEIRAMLSYEAQKQALGCDAGSSCLAEIGGALGVRYLVSGTIGKVGDAYAFNLVLTDIDTAKVESRVSENVKEQGKLLDVTARSSKVLVSKILADRQATLLVTCAEKGALVKIDGQIVGSTPLPRRKISWGPHLVEVEKTGFVAYVEDFTVLTKGVIERNVTLIPSPDFLASYESGASKMRLGAWITTAGAALALGAAGFFQSQYLGQASAFTDARRAYDALPPNQAAWDALNGQKLAAESTLLNARVGAAVGLALAAGATFFWIAGEDPDRYARYRELAALDETPAASPSGLRLPKWRLGLLDATGLVSATLELP
jgi:TolB-like protein